MQREKLKTILRVGGIVVAAIGGICLPIPNRVFDQGDLGVYYSLADTGAFTQIGIGLLVVGIGALGLSFLVRSDMTD
jgi:hypothetical protein